VNQRFEWLSESYNRVNVIVDTINASFISLSGQTFIDSRSFISVFALKMGIEQVLLIHNFDYLTVFSQANFLNAWSTGVCATWLV
jgi:hypothetical protein